MFQPGAYLDQVTGDEKLTIYSPANIISPKNNNIFDGDVVDFSVGGMIYTSWWGTDATAVGNAFASMPTLSTLIFSPGVTYTINSEVDCAIKNYSVVEAYGAYFTASHNGVMFDVNSAADPGDPEGSIRHRFLWKGGKFYNSNGTKTASEALRLRCFRECVIQDCYFEGFFNAINYVARDTFHFRDCRFYANVHGIYSPDWLTGGSTTILTNVDNCHFSIDNKTSGVTVLGSWYNIHINNCSFNGAVTDAIYIETNKGSASANNSLYVAQNHFEQAATRYVYVKDVDGAVHGVRIVSNSFGAGGTDAVVLENCVGVKIDANAFHQTTAAGGLPVSLDTNCDRVVFEANRYSSAVPSISCSRQNVTFVPEVRYSGDGSFPLPSYNGDSFSTGSATIDMSSEISSIFPSEATPKAYILNVNARDSGSSTTDCRVTFAKTSTVYSGSPDRQPCLSLSGVSDDVKTGRDITVLADDNGDIYINYVASGADTLDIWVSVQAVLM